MLKVLKWIIKTGLICTLLGVTTLLALYFYISPDLPDASKLKEFKLQTPLKVYSQDGKLISQYGDKKRIPLTLDEIPVVMRNAFLAIEDNRFYQHPGIDPIGIGRAVINLIATGRKGQGASTITQQVARNYFLTREKTYIRKIREVFLAWNIEQALTKDEILLAYLNKIPLGHRSFGVGAAAQVYYGKKVNELSLAQIAIIAGLPKAPSSLNPIRSPSRAKARRNLVLKRMLALKYIDQTQYDEAVSAPITAKRHGAKIELYAPYLGEMVRAHMVNKYGREEAYSNGFNVYTTVNSKIQNAAQSAIEKNILNYDKRHGYRGPEQHIDIELLIEQAQLKEKSPQLGLSAHSNQVITSALKSINDVRILLPAVVTKVDPLAFNATLRTGESITLSWDHIKWARPYIDDDHQGNAPKQASDIIARGDVIRVFKRGKVWHLSQIPEVSSALVSLDPYDGAVRAIIGGFDFNTSQFNRVTQAKRQIGSNIKPFLYSYAMDRGFTLSSIINDVPITQWDSSQNSAWRPKNSPPIYNGPTRLRLGLSQSKNVMSVKLIQKLGIKNTINHLSKFGFNKSELPIAESLALGSASVTPLEAATGYATFANGGFLVKPYYIERINDSNHINLVTAAPLVACSACENKASVSQDIMDSLNTDFLTQQCMLDKSRVAPRVISEQNAFLVREMMRSVITGGGDWSKKTGWSGTGWRVARVIKRKDVGGKTGTTNDSKDAWFSGITPHLVASTWIGFDGPSRALGRTRINKNLPKDQIKGGESGAKSAMPGWIDFMNVALRDYPEQPKQVPSKISTVRIDITTGLLTTKTDHTSRFEYFIEGTQPTKYTDSASSVKPLNDVTDSAFDDDIF